MNGINNTDPFKTGYKFHFFNKFLIKFFWRLFINKAEKIDERKKRLGELYSLTLGSNNSPSSHYLSYA